MIEQIPFVLQLINNFSFDNFVSSKVPTKQYFLFFLMKEHKKIRRLPFIISQYLI